MPNWWQQWAERIALILAEWWVESRGGSPGSAPPDGRVSDTPDAPQPPAPDANVPSDG
jgi:hypothetical protein